MINLNPVVKNNSGVDEHSTHNSLHMVLPRSCVLAVPFLDYKKKKAWKKGLRRKSKDQRKLSLPKRSKHNKLLMIKVISLGIVGLYMHPILQNAGVCFLSFPKHLKCRYLHQRLFSRGNRPLRMRWRAPGEDTSVKSFPMTA